MANGLAQIRHDDIVLHKFSVLLFISRFIVIHLFGFSSDENQLLGLSRCESLEVNIFTFFELLDSGHLVFLDPFEIGELLVLIIF